MERTFCICLQEVLLLTAAVILTHQPFPLTVLLRSPHPAQVPLSLHKLPLWDVKSGHLFLSLTNQ